MAKPNLHQLIDAVDKKTGKPAIPAAGLLTSWLANYWLGKAFSAGERYMDYVRGGSQGMDLAFLQDSNNECNHIYGFDKLEIPATTFLRYVDGYIYCVAENMQKAVNAPFDTVRPLAAAVQWRKDFVPKGQRTQDFDGDVMTESMQKILSTLVETLGTKKQENSQRKRLEVIDFVYGEIEPQLAFTMNQVNKDSGFMTRTLTDMSRYVDAEILDSYMPEEDQDIVLGDCYRRGDEITHEGLRGTYAVACANLKRAMFNEEQKRALSGIYYDTMLSWVHLMKLGKTPSKPTKPKGTAK